MLIKNPKVKLSTIILNTLSDSIETPLATWMLKHLLSETITKDF